MKDLAKRCLRGDVRAVSRIIRDLEDEVPNTYLAMKEIFPHTGKAHVVGLTGAPGAGKSTLTDELTAAYRKKDKSIGVLAIDPTSPFTGGALLGDRIRMLRHSEDKAVFVRSLATRGSMGGLSKAVGEGIHVLDAMGKEKVIVETCGVGQQEVDIINHAHTVVVVLVPGMGDEIQALKAGLMEIADIFVINKSDREGGGKLYKEVLNMVTMARKHGNNKSEWIIPVLRMGSILEPHEFAKDVEVLRDKIDEHYDYLVKSNLLAERRRRKTVAELQEAIWGNVLQPVLNELTASGELEKMADRLMSKETDPYTLAEEVGQRYMK